MFRGVENLFDKKNGMSNKIPVTFVSSLTGAVLGIGVAATYDWGKNRVERALGRDVAWDGSVRNRRILVSAIGGGVYSGGLGFMFSERAFQYIILTSTGVSLGCAMLEDLFPEDN
jgi:hypothetical protein